MPICARRVSAVSHPGFRHLFGCLMMMREASSQAPYLRSLRFQFQVQVLMFFAPSSSTGYGYCSPSAKTTVPLALFSHTSNSSNVSTRFFPSQRTRNEIAPSSNQQYSKESRRVTRESGHLACGLKSGGRRRRRKGVPTSHMLERFSYSGFGFGVCSFSLFDERSFPFVIPSLSLSFMDGMLLWI